MILADKFSGAAGVEAYFLGDLDTIERVAKRFHFYSAYYGLPENEKAVSIRELVELLSAVYGKK